MDNLTPKEIADEEMINQAFHELLNDYLNTKHRKKVEIITKAFNFANQAHKGIKRRSGEPYIMHPIAVASIVCNEIGLGSTSICAALLHDVVEDTDYTVEDIENIFGPKIAQIVDGLTKISGGIFGDRASAQAENFKKLLLTMSNDIRVILIKIADRLHNMRTLGSMLPNKQYKIAGETLYIYAPLANRLGLYKIKTELENLSFKYEHPEEYAEIEEKLNATAAERDKVFNDFTAPIRTQLDKMGLKYRILARVKSIYSIWNKMQPKHVPTTVSLIAWKQYLPCSVLWSKIRMMRKLLITWAIGITTSASTTWHLKHGKLRLNWMTSFRRYGATWLWPTLTRRTKKQEPSSIWSVLSGSIRLTRVC